MARRQRVDVGHPLPLMAELRILDIPFHERPPIELLALDRDEDPEYAGYGWAKVPRVWLDSGHGWMRALDDVLVIAIHAADDAEPRDDDVDLDFEIDDEVIASADATAFVTQWLPRLPDARHVVLVMCNPHRARLPAFARDVWQGIGDVRAWLDPGDRIRLTAEAWRKVRAVNQLERPGESAVSDEEKMTYAGLYVLKKMDLKPKEGGMVFPIKLPTELMPLEEVLHHLATEGYVEMNTRKDRYDLTKKGSEYLGRVIDEAGDLIDEFDDDEMEDVVIELRRRRLNVIRARFVWGWYDGEFDDLVIWQEQRGVKPVERMWALYLLGDDFWNELADEVDVEDGAGTGQRAGRDGRGDGGGAVEDDRWGRRRERDDDDDD